MYKMFQYFQRSKILFEHSGYYVKLTSVDNHNLKIIKRHICASTHYFCTIRSQKWICSAVGLNIIIKNLQQNGYMIITCCTKHTLNLYVYSYMNSSVLALAQWVLRSKNHVHFSKGIGYFNHVHFAKD